MLLPIFLIFILRNLPVPVDVQFLEVRLDLLTAPGQGSVGLSVCATQTRSCPESENVPCKEVLWRNWKKERRILFITFKGMEECLVFNNEARAHLRLAPSRQRHPQFVQRNDCEGVHALVSES